MFLNFEKHARYVVFGIIANLKSVICLKVNIIQCFLYIGKKKTTVFSSRLD